MWHRALFCINIHNGVSLVKVVRQNADDLDHDKIDTKFLTYKFKPACKYWDIIDSKSVQYRICNIYSFKMGKSQRIFIQQWVHNWDFLFRIAVPVVSLWGCTLWRVQFNLRGN